MRTQVLNTVAQLETLLHAAGLGAAEREGFESERLMALSTAVDAMGAAGAGGSVPPA